MTKFMFPTARLPTYVVSSQDAIGKLQGANDNEEEQECVNQLRALRCLLDVVVVDILNDDVPVRGAPLGRTGLC